jgi:hypothetical protein
LQTPFHSERRPSLRCDSEACSPTCSHTMPSWTQLLCS